MKLYDDKNKGYFNAGEVINNSRTKLYVIGGRGIGKTFGVLKWLIQNNHTFMYLRRTQAESDLQASEMSSSLTKLLRLYTNEYEFKKLNAKVGMIEYDGKGVIYTCALSTFASIRGVNFDDVEYIVFDEFIKEPHIKSIKAEALAWENLLESVERNRTWDEGKEPVKSILLANSMDIANDIFIHYDLVPIAEVMLEEKEEIYEEGDTTLVICQNSPVSKAKAETERYKNAGEDFARMSIKNEFILNDFSYVKKRNIKEYKVLLNVGDLYLYRNKNEDDYYVSFTKATTKPSKQYKNTLTDLERFRRAEWRYYERYLDGYIKFENYKAVSLFEKYYEK